LVYVFHLVGCAFVGVGVFCLEGFLDYGAGLLYDFSGITRFFNFYTPIFIEGDGIKKLGNLFLEFNEFLIAFVAGIDSVLDDFGALNFGQYLIFQSIKKVVVFTSNFFSFSYPFFDEIVIIGKKIFSLFIYNLN
jgi:hypothetical protein